MSDAHATLVRCFEVTFPELANEAIPTASVETIEEWDSLRSVTLLAVLEEEFDMQIPLEDLPSLRSFDAVSEYLRKAKRRP